jgi:PAS domain S-box-containing protein
MPSVDLMPGINLVVSLSAVLVRLSEDGTDATLRAAAATIAEHSGATEHLVWDLTEAGDARAVGAVPVGVDLEELAGPGWRDRLGAGEIINGGAGPGVRRSVVPVRANGVLLGALALVGTAKFTPDWDDPAFAAAIGVLAAGWSAARAIDREAAVARDARTMLDDVPAVLVRIGVDGKMAFVNKAWTTLTGIAYEDIVGRDAMHHVHPDDRVLAAQHMAAIVGGSVESREMRFLDAAGTPRWMEVKGHPLFEGGVMTSFAGLLIDVTQRRGAELHANEARSRAEHAQQVAERASRAKTDFLSRMSHELRTPLNAIVGFADLLADSPMAEEDRDSVEQISVAGRHLLDLVTEALDVTQIEHGKLPLHIEPLQVAGIAVECLGLMRPAAGDHQIALHAVPAEHAGLRVLADAQRLRQVLLNLLSNAVKYNHPGGQVHVDCEPLVLETPVGGSAPHGWLRITVTDDGRGIPPDRLDDVFLPFERVGAERSEVPGTGLGLALTRGLVEAMHGQITVYSVPGVGTTLRVDLPAAPPSQTGPELTEAHR